MIVHPVVTHQNSVVSLQMTVKFTGEVTDADDQKRIAAYGDPLVNMGGTFVDPLDSAFSFNTASSDYYAKLTTEMSSKAIRFFKALPQTAPGQTTAQLSALDVITTDPVRAAGVYNEQVGNRIQSAMVSLRALTPVALTTLPDKTV